MQIDIFEFGQIVKTIRQRARQAIVGQIKMGQILQQSHVFTQRPGQTLIGPIYLCHNGKPEEGVVDARDTRPRAFGRAVDEPGGVVARDAKLEGIQGISLRQQFHVGHERH
jgi:hypothetical protein